MANTYIDNRDAIIAYVDALIVITPDLNIMEEARSYCRTNSIPVTTWDIDDLVSQIVRNKQEAAAAAVPVAYTVYCSDETTALVPTVAIRRFRMPFAMTLTSVRANVNAAPTDTASPVSGTLLTVDINSDTTGSPVVASILSTKLTIDNDERTSTTATTPAVISGTTFDLADDVEVIIDLDSVGATAKGTGLKVTFIGNLPTT